MNNDVMNITRHRAEHIIRFIFAVCEHDINGLTSWKYFT